MRQKIQTQFVLGRLANIEAAAKFKESKKCSWLALQEKKQTALLLQDAAKQDIQKEILKVKKRLMKNDYRLLEIRDICWNCK